MRTRLTASPPSALSEYAKKEALATMTSSLRAYEGDERELEEKIEALNRILEQAVTVTGQADPEAAKEVADAIMKAMLSVKSADVPVQNLVVRFSESVDGFPLPKGHSQSEALAAPQVDPPDAQKNAPRT